LFAHLFLQLENGDLELGLDLGVVGLDALEAVNAAANGGGESLDVTRRLTDERAELALRESKERGVLYQ
jgi:hypothetical protein